MSKKLGQKIVVKFNKALLGDVVGNHTAFTVTGMQKNPLFHGELQQKQYTVASVVRYPVGVLYEDGFSGQMDGVEVGGNGVILTLPEPSLSVTDNLQLWLDASQITGLNDGDPVATWADVSGYSRSATQSTAGKRPIYKTNILNGKPVLRFDGADDVMVTPSILNTDIHTIFVVAKTSKTESDIIGTGGNSAGHILMMRFQSLFRGHFWTSTSANAIDSASDESGGWTVYMQEVNTSQIIVRRNGNLSASATLIGTKQGATRPFYIGNRDNSRIQGMFSGDIAEIIAYNTALSTTDRQAVEAYLMDKYGIGGA